MTAVLVIFIIYSVVYFSLGEIRERNGRIEKYTEASPPPIIEESDIVYKGISNSMADEEVEQILTRRSFYYASLDQQLKAKFLYRLHHFLNKKTFIIKSSEGFKEMPVLVSAAAIQLTFGLNDYLFSFYKYIRIYPQEYLGDDFLKVLAGNVENNTITIAWNQFLKGNEDLTDGSNVGLHEMSHALYFQKLIIDGDYAKHFCSNYNHLLSECQEAYKTEVAGRKNLYSEYADTNLQEFWAESAEIFFEKPTELKIQYPSVYEAMKILLNQDPLNKTFPVIHSPSTLSQRISKFLGQRA